VRTKQEVSIQRALRNVRTSVECLPHDKRRVPRPYRGSMPIALKTCRVKREEEIWNEKRKEDT
jgi:hypothetical protein